MARRITVPRTRAAAAPRSVWRRAADRVAGALGYKREQYHGAAQNRLTADWVTAPLSADATIRGDLRLLRDRARQLVRDNAYANRFLAAAADNIIGADGVRLQCLVKKADGSLDRETNATIESGWADWCLPEHASVDGLLSMTDVATLAVETWKRDGEALLRLWDGFDNPHGFAVQVLDPDMLDHQLNRAAAQTMNGRENEIRMGVERNQWGRPVAYWLWAVHPNDGGILSSAMQERVRVPAADIIHLYTVERPGQTRGVTAYACVMGDLNHLGGYQEAELIAARTGAANPVVYEQSDPLKSNVDEDTPTEIPMEFEAATGYLLPGGVSAKVLAAEHPSTAFGEFVRAILRAIAAGLGTSYALLTGDLSNANYSSLREGKVQERDRWRRAQAKVSVHLYRRLFLRWLRMAVLTGRVQLPSVRIERFAAHRWLPRGWPWVDPEKDLRSAALEIALRLNTRANIAGANGRDWIEVVNHLAEEEELLEELELPSVGVAPGLKPDTEAPVEGPADDPADARPAAA